MSGGHISITENGINKSCIDVRKITGAVLQGDSLLNGTIIYNITFNDSSPSKDVIELTKMIGIHDVIESLPMGYHTTISDSNNVLSAGQKQKILLARAMYRNPQLLILMKQQVILMLSLNIRLVWRYHRSSAQRLL